jgi:ATP-dependent DNA helicase DinG
MPRLSDLLSEQLKKKLFSDAKKNAPAPVQRQDEQRQHKPGREHAKSAPAPVIPIPDFVAIDVETTGLDFSRDRVIEVGAIRFIAGKPGEEFSSFTNPGVPIPEQITELTSIADSDVASAPAFAAIADNLLSFVGDLPLCGHQIDFDLTFLNKELERAGKKTFGKQNLDTVLLSKIILESGRRYSLKSVSKSLEVTLDNAHRALHDARASGEVAVALIPRLLELPLAVRQTMAAAAPASFIKGLIFKSLGNMQAAVRVRPNAQVVNFSKLPVPEAMTEIKVDEVESIFSKNGALSSLMPSFIPRKAQSDMAVEVTNALNTQSILVAEAGTGTGKSLAYLVPSAIWAMENKTRVIVATRTRNLQDQLVSKELPLLSSIAGSAFRSTVLKGRSNYICLNRWEQLLRGEAGNMSLRERYAILPLIPWVESTATGDIEEQNQFNPKWFGKIWDLISAESHGCQGRRCPLFKSCFLQQARNKALGSHIVVINHALFFSEMCSGTSFLGKIGTIIFDEAHHLESSGHTYLRVELDTNRIAFFMEELNSLVQLIGNLKENNEILDRGKEIKSHLKQIRKRSQSFLQSISDWAKKKKQDIFPPEFQIRYGESDFSQDIEALAFANTLDMLKDQLHDLKQMITGSTLPKSALDPISEETLSCVERTSQLSADLCYLMAGKTEDHAFWAEGNLEKGWSKLCGVPLDIASLLSGIWEQCEGSVIFTSATLSVARSPDYFSNSVGLASHTARTAVAVFPSPFGREQAILGAIRTAPDPDSPEYVPFVASVISDLHAAFGKNILVLFTANAMLSAVYKQLRATPGIDRKNILAQNISGGRHALLEQFKEQSRMILLGTDSFWEGIDVPGNACEIVVMPRLPFPVPAHPLVQAISEKMTAQHGESFMSYALPEAVIRFRQGCGRLIRTMSDRGALVVLDNRIINKGYGKQFIRSLDADFNTFGDRAAMLEAVSAFFNGSAPAAPASTISYVPFDEV